MAERLTFDLLIVGAQTAGYAAAAAGARLGASVALIRTGNEGEDEGLVSEPPNFVWRLLDLHQYGFEAEPVAAQISFFADGRAPAVYQNRARTIDSISEYEEKAEFYWPEFLRELSATRRVAGDACETAGAAEGDRPVRSSLAASVYATADSVLDDRFDSEALKTHLANMALSPFALAGDEAGSARALGEIVAGWPMTTQSLKKLRASLEQACTALGVRVFNGPLASLTLGDRRFYCAALGGGDVIRARKACASSAFLAQASGVAVVADAPALTRRRGAAATVRLKYETPPVLENAAAGAVGFAVADRKALARARDAMIEGRIPEAAPFSFEISGDAIVARAFYCPAKIRDGASLRDWTGQDKQILGRQIAAQLEKYLSPGVGSLVRIGVSLGPDVEDRDSRRAARACAPILAPAPSIDSIGAAAALVMEMIGNE